MARVTFLGVKGGPAIRPGTAMPTSHLLEIEGRTIVIDAGLGVASAIVRQGIELTAIDAVFITHLHSDHYLELGPLLHTAWTAGLKHKVDIFGPSGLADYFSRFLESMAVDIDLRIADEGRPDLGELVRLQVMESPVQMHLGKITVSAMDNIHPPLEESFALKFEAGDRKIVFSGDTAYTPKMAGFAKNADLLVHEAMLKDGIDALCARVANGDDRLKQHLLRSHCSAAAAGKIAHQAEVGILALNHFVPGDDPRFTDADWRAEVETEWYGDLRIGKDGMVIEL